MKLSRSQPCIGIFKDEPENIVRGLPRPKTPFVPAPQPAADSGDEDYQAALWITEGSSPGADSVNGSPSLGACLSPF
jgi:hypothetical protein